MATKTTVETLNETFGEPCNEVRKKIKTKDKNGLARISVSKRQVPALDKDDSKLSSLPTRLRARSRHLSPSLGCLIATNSSPLMKRISMRPTSTMITEKAPRRSEQTEEHITPPKKSAGIRRLANALTILGETLLKTRFENEEEQDEDEEDSKIKGSSAIITGIVIGTSIQIIGFSIGYFVMILLL